MSNEPAGEWCIIGFMTTPTTINDISDIVRILRERPDWLEIIRGIVVGDELLSVPQELAELTQRVDGLAQRVDELAQRVDELAQQVGELTQRLDEFVRATNDNFRLVNERLDRLETGQAELRRDFARLEGRFSNFEGSDYERRVRNRLVSRSVYHFDLISPVIVMTQDSQSAPEFNSVMQRAIRSGAITRDEYEDLHEADIIIKDEGDRYLLAEVSITAENDDVERAVRRSQLLAAVADSDVIPALVSSNVPRSATRPGRCPRRQHFHHPISLTCRTASR